jgi:hypothetical protein
VVGLDPGVEPARGDLTRLFLAALVQPIGAQVDLAAPNQAVPPFANLLIVQLPKRLMTGIDAR